MTKTTRASKGNKKRNDPDPTGMGQNQKTIRSIKAKADEKRSFIDVLADRTTALLGSNVFLFINLLIFISWIVINTGQIPGIKPFDKFPFSLLTTSVSLEAIILAILVLISQNRASKVADLREEVQLQVNVITEEKITRIMSMLVLLLQKNGIPIPEDLRLQEMLRDTDVSQIEKSVENEIDNS